MLCWTVSLKCYLFCLSFLLAFVWMQLDQLLTFWIGFVNSLTPSMLVTERFRHAHRSRCAHDGTVPSRPRPRLECPAPGWNSCRSDAVKYIFFLVVLDTSVPLLWHPVTSTTGAIYGLCPWEPVHAIHYRQTRKLFGLLSPWPLLLLDCLTILNIFSWK